MIKRKKSGGKKSNSDKFIFWVAFLIIVLSGYGMMFKPEPIFSTIFNSWLTVFNFGILLLIISRMPND